MKPNISQDYLKSILHYEPDSGIFTWLVNLGKKRTQGKRAGCLRKKPRDKTAYREIRINRCSFAEHRLAFLYMTGSFSKELVDHVNRDGTDNRWENLRAASDSQNQANSIKPTRNTSGFKGVTKSRKRWQASIGFQGRFLRIGSFDTPEQAGQAYADKAKELFGEFARV